MNRKTKHKRTLMVLSRKREEELIYTLVLMKFNLRWLPIKLISECYLSCIRLLCRSRNRVKLLGVLLNLEDKNSSSRHCLDYPQKEAIPSLVMQESCGIA